MFRRIIVPVELEHQETPALDLAIRLTQRLQGELTLVHTTEDLPRYMRFPDHKRAQHLEELLLREAQDKLDAIGRHWREHTPQIHTQVLRGHPVLEIMQEVARGRYDLLIKDRGDADEERNDIRLVRKCPVATWIVSPHAPPVKKILACVDPEPDDGYRNRICEKVTTSALELGRALGAEVHLLRVWSAFMESAAIRHLPQYAYDEYKREIQHSLHTEFEYFLQRFAGLKLEPHFVEGDPDEVIRRFVGEQAIDTVVVGTSSRRGLASFFMGSTAEKIIEHAGCSVLSIKPDDFSLRLPAPNYERQEQLPM